jgi:DNA polymerase/3'-5' exonuclease PolX
MSSATTRIPLDRALLLAARIEADLDPYCELIELAGSLRRRTFDVGDLEVVCIPRTRRETDLFGDPVGPSIDMLTEHLEALQAAGTIRRRPDKNGRAGGLNRLTWRFGDDITEVEIGLDIFRALPTTLGCVLALRTGPYQLSKRLVTQRAKAGLCPNEMEFKDGGLWRYIPGAGAGRRAFVPTPDETTLFRELGLPFVAPEHRFATTFEREGRR